MCPFKCEWRHKTETQKERHQDNRIWLDIITSSSLATKLKHNLFITSNRKSYSLSILYLTFYLTYTAILIIITNRAANDHSNEQRKNTTFKDHPYTSSSLEENVFDIDITIRPFTIHRLLSFNIKSTISPLLSSLSLFCSIFVKWYNWWRTIVLRTDK